MGARSAPSAREAYCIGKEWFGKDSRVPLKSTKKNVAYPELHREQEIERKMRFKRGKGSATTPTFGKTKVRKKQFYWLFFAQHIFAHSTTFPIVTRAHDAKLTSFKLELKDSGTSSFRPKFNGSYPAGSFLHDQAGGNVLYAGSAALSFLQKKSGAGKRSMKNSEALAIISNWHALGGSNIARDYFNVETEHSNAVSYDKLSDMQSAFVILQKYQGYSGDQGDMISCDLLRKVLTLEGEKLSEAEIDSMVAEADQDGSGWFNFKHFCKVMTDKRLPNLPKGSSYGPQDDVVMMKQRERIMKMKAKEERTRQMKEAGLTI